MVTLTVNLSFDVMLLVTSTQKKMSFSFHHVPFGIWDQTYFVVYKSEGKDKSTLKNKSCESADSVVAPLGLIHG